IHSAFINVVAWILTVAGGIAFLAATAGVIYCLVTPESTATEVESSLHDTYYIIRHSKFIVWPLLLCMSLSAAIAILGYMYTTMHMNRLMRQHTSSSTKG